jgi:hypothetical protein
MAIAVGRSRNALLRHRTHTQASPSIAELGETQRTLRLLDFGLDFLPLPSLGAAGADSEVAQSAIVSAVLGVVQVRIGCCRIGACDACLRCAQQELLELGLGLAELCNTPALRSPAIRTVDVCYRLALKVERQPSALRCALIPSAQVAQRVHLNRPTGVGPSLSAAAMASLVSAFPVMAVLPRPHGAPPRRAPLRVQWGLMVPVAQTTRWWATARCKP